MNHHPDFSSSDDELEDDFDFQEFLVEQRRNQNRYLPQLTDEQKREQQVKDLYIHLINGKVAEVISELDNGLDVAQNLQSDWTPILVAASIANYDLIKELHNRGADVKSTRDGQTTLMLVCNCPENTSSFDESTKVIELLLELGVNPKAINRKRMNALMFAANNGNLEAVKLLVPVSDLGAVDNQNWNALFWSVNSGRVEIVEYLIDKGLPIDKVDVRGNTTLDIARDNDFDQIIHLFSSEEEIDDFVIDQSKSDFESTFRDLETKQKPKFSLDISKILHGTRCEKLVKLFIEKEVSLLEFLSFTESDFKDLGVQMPFQRRRLGTGVHRFHKYPYHPKSLPTVGQNELYSNMDAAAAILSAVKQIITMEASLKYIMKNVDCNTFFVKNREIRQSLVNIERKLQRLKLVASKLEQKASSWDAEIEAVDIITSQSGRRWFPWRKVMFMFGIVAIINFKLWNKSTLRFRI